MTFNSYARNVCNFRKKVMVNDYKQLGFWSLMRTHLSNELLNMMVRKLRPLRTWAQVSSCGPAGNETWLPHGWKQARVPECDELQHSWIRRCLAIRLPAMGSYPLCYRIPSSGKAICLHHHTLKCAVKWIQLKSTLTPLFGESAFLKTDHL